MKINEITSRSTQGTSGSVGSSSNSLEVEKVNDNETVLVDPKTKVKTVVPKDPKKPGIIQKDKRGQLVLNKKTSGPVDSDVKPGDKVSVS